MVTKNFSKQSSRIYKIFQKSFSSIDTLVQQFYETKNEEQFLNKIVLQFISLQPELNKELFAQAVLDAYQFHKNQRRDSGLPYLVHPLHVAYLAAFDEQDQEVIIAGLFHDSIEDAFSYQEQQRRVHYLGMIYGNEVLSLVYALTKDTSSNRKERVARQYLFFVDHNDFDRKAAQLKMYDIIANLITLHDMKLKKGLTAAERKQRFLSDLKTYALPRAQDLDKWQAKVKDQIKIPFSSFLGYLFAQNLKSQRKSLYNVSH